MIRKMMKNILGESYTENNGKLAIVNFGIILIMFFVSGIMLLFLPDAEICSGIIPYDILLLR